MAAAAAGVPPLPAAPPRPDPACTAAFSAGWVVATLHGTLLSEDLGPADALPAIQELGRNERVSFGLDQLDVLLTTLRPLLHPRAGGVPATTDAARHAWDPATPAPFRTCLEDLHLVLVEGLTLGRSHLGSSYVLGRWLADLSGKPTTKEGFAAQYSKARLSALQGVLKDLDGVFAPHAAAAVSGGLAHWAAWLSVSSDGDWKDTNGRATTTVATAAVAQGEHWRALLSGEKDPTSLLTPEAYVQAGEAALRRAGTIAWRVLANFWLPIVIAVAVIVGAVFVALFYAKGTAKVWTSVVAAAGGLGITAQGIKTAARQAATKAGGSLLEGAESDAIGWAATWLPPTAAQGAVAGRSHSRKLRRMGVAPPSSPPALPVPLPPPGDAGAAGQEGPPA